MKHITLSILLGLIFPAILTAQTDKAVQDSIAFHQSFMTSNQQEQPKRMMLQSTATTNIGSFTLAGDQNTYYPVAFSDKGWDANEATIVEIGRSSVHLNSTWNGSLLATFTFHVTRWGHGSGFIDADIKQHTPSTKTFIGGWQDITGGSNGLNVIIWLRGAATYYYHSNYPQTPLFTSDVLTVEGVTYLSKTQPENYVNPVGTTLAKNIWVIGTQANYFKSNVGIGISNPKNMLDVAGTIHAQNVEVNLTGWSDFVFDADYKLPSLSEVEAHIQEHKHLPNIPSETQVKEEGINIGEMQAKLLQKIEELTLYVIDLKKENQHQEELIKSLQSQLPANK